jgi:hypothetical protein
MGGKGRRPELGLSGHRGCALPTAAMDWSPVFWPITGNKVSTKAGAMSNAEGSAPASKLDRNRTSSGKAQMPEAKVSQNRLSQLML